MTWRGCWRCGLPVYLPHEVCSSCTVDAINEANANEARAAYERACQAKVTAAARRVWGGESA